MTWPQLGVKVMPPRGLTVIFPLRSLHLPTCGLKVTREGGRGEQEDGNQCMGGPVKTSVCELGKPGPAEAGRLLQAQPLYLALSLGRDAFLLGGLGDHLRG